MSYALVKFGFYVFGELCCVIVFFKLSGREVLVYTLFDFLCFKN